MDHGAVVIIKSQEEWDAALKKADAEGEDGTWHSVG